MRAFTSLARRRGALFVVSRRAIQRGDVVVHFVYTCDDSGTRPLARQYLRVSPAALTIADLHTIALQRTLAVPSRPALFKSAAGPSDRKPRKSEAGALVPVWLSKQQVESLAQVVFGSKTEDAFVEVRAHHGDCTCGAPPQGLGTLQQFMHAMKAFVQSQPTKRPTSRLVEASELLFIAAETYEKSSTTLRDRFPGAGRERGIARVDMVSSGPSLLGGEAIASESIQTSGGEEDEAVSLPHSVKRPVRMTAAMGARQETSSALDGRPKIKETVVRAASTATSGASGNGEVQTRLDSLLERMRKRQQQDPDCA